MSPRVKASLADISTEFTPIDPGEYEVEVTEVEEKTKDDDRVHYIVTYQVKGLMEDGTSIPSDFNDRKGKDFIHIHTKEGELNEVGLVQLKRWAEATVGEERANADDFDTDEMKSGRAVATLGIKEYQGRKNNEVKYVKALD